MKTTRPSSESSPVTRSLLLFRVSGIDFAAPTDHLRGVAGPGWQPDSTRVEGSPGRANLADLFELPAGTCTRTLLVADGGATIGLAVDTICEHLEAGEIHPVPAALQEWLRRRVLVGFLPRGSGLAPVLDLVALVRLAAERRPANA